VTSGGLYGTIIGFGEDNRIKVKIAENVKVDIARSAISSKVAAAIEAGKGKDS
jgi:preprotein translocase subunit YajC